MSFSKSVANLFRVTLLLNKVHLAAVGWLTIGLLLALPAAAKPPNIVLLVGDDVGYSDLGAYGSEINTPNLDALAASGVRFSNFHVTASCSPTRSMLMTGVDNHLNGLGNMDLTMPAAHRGQPGYEGVLNDQVVTVAQMLRDNGYHTYQLGKWHLGRETHKLPYHRGFERTIALADTGADNWQQRSYLPTYAKAHWFADGQEHKLPDNFYSSRYFVDKAIEFIGADQADQQPFFTYIGFQAVHTPLQAPEAFVQKYHQAYQAGWAPVRQQRLERAIQLGLVPANTQLVDMPTTRNWSALAQKDQAYYSRRMAVYAGMLDAMDFHIGRLVNYLKEIGEFDNTIFIFLSDNGPEPTDPLEVLPMAAWVKLNYSTRLEDLGAKGAYTSLSASWASAAASPGAYYKFYAGEGGVRVPLIVSGRPLAAENKIASSFAYIKDIVPTILELSSTPDHGGQFNSEPVQPITGESLVPVIRGQAEVTHDPAKPIGYELAGNAALYRGEYKLVVNRPPLGDGQWHLYDIVADPGEANDLSASMPDLHAQMLDDYKTYARQHAVQEMPEGYNYVTQIMLYSAKAIAKRNAPYWAGFIFIALAGVVFFRRRARRRW